MRKPMCVCTTSCMWGKDFLCLLLPTAGMAGFYMLRKFFPTFSPVDTGMLLLAWIAT